MAQAASRTSQLPSDARPLWFAVFEFFGEANHRDNQRIELVSELISVYRYGRVSINWLEGSVNFRHGPLFGTYRPWNIVRFFDQSAGWLDEDEKETVRQILENFWDRLKGDLRYKLYNGKLEMWARPTPFAAFQALEVDMWPHFEIEDWEHGRAKAEGGYQIFSVHVVPTKSPHSKQTANRNPVLPLAKPGRPPKANWPAIKDLLRIEIKNRGGIPDSENAAGWKTQQDAIELVHEWLRERDEFPGETQTRANVARMLKELSVEGGNQ